jgi:hypothetical protein
LEALRVDLRDGLAFPESSSTQDAFDSVRRVRLRVAVVPLRSFVPGRSRDAEVRAARLAAT